MLSTLQSEDEEVESALIPFLQAYVSKLRNSQKRGSAISQVPGLVIISAGLIGHTFNCFK